MGRIQFSHAYEDIISIDNLLDAWEEFVCGKKNRKDVQVFQMRLFENISQLHVDLNDRTYVHSAYSLFKLNDPKPGDIHKATVRDRLLHHAIYRKLYPFFDRTFIADSYSCRNRKGTHRAFEHFSDLARRYSMSHTRTMWVLKCDIRKFFASVDHDVLLKILSLYIPDRDIIWLLNQIITSFNSAKHGIGLRKIIF